MHLEYSKSEFILVSLMTISSIKDIMIDFLKDDHLKQPKKMN